MQVSRRALHIGAAPFPRGTARLLPQGSVTRSLGDGRGCLVCARSRLMLRFFVVLHGVSVFGQQARATARRPCTACREEGVRSSLSLSCVFFLLSFSNACACSRHRTTAYWAGSCARAVLNEHKKMSGVSDKQSVKFSRTNRCNSCRE